jgi:iron complex transport system substrate-binding protein
VSATTHEPLERIVCLTEEPTEILYALGEGRRVVGISAWTVRPPEARRDKPVVSGFTGGNVGRIAALRPDLVIGFSDIQARLAAQLIEAGLQVLVFNQRTIEEILGVVLALGRLVGAEARALTLVAGYRAGIEAARAWAASRSRRPRVYFEEWPDPMITGIRWVSELIEVAGGEDLFAERSHGRMARERFVSSEEVVERAPEVILASWCGKPFEPDRVRARPGWEAVPAVRRGALHGVDSALILQPGPACLTDGLAALEAILARS